MTTDEVFAVVREAILAVLPEVPADQVRRDRSMRELGADSLDRLDIMAGVAAVLGIEVPAHRLAGVGDIGGLVEVLHRLVGGGAPVPVGGGA